MSKSITDRLRKYFQNHSDLRTIAKSACVPPSALTAFMNGGDMGLSVAEKLLAYIERPPPSAVGEQCLKGDEIDSGLVREITTCLVDDRADQLMRYWFPKDGYGLWGHKQIKDFSESMRSQQRLICHAWAQLIVSVEIDEAWGLRPIDGEGSMDRQKRLAHAIKYRKITKAQYAKAIAELGVAPRPVRQRPATATRKSAR